MTTRQKQMVRETFEAIRDEAGPVATLFYGRLFELEPDLRRMFPREIERQGLKLMEMLAAIVEHLDRLETLNPVLQAMGQRHAGYGVVERHYEIVDRALIWSLSQALDGGLDAEHKVAWHEVITYVATAMMEGANGPARDERMAGGPDST